MFLSQLIINLGDDPARRRPGREWIRKPYRIHQRLCMAFPDNKHRDRDPDFLQPFNPGDFRSDVQAPRDGGQGFLFRVDADSPAGLVVLVQSARRPQWDYAFHNACYLLHDQPNIIEFTLSAQMGQRYRFRLRANVTKKLGTRTKEERLAGRPRENGYRAPIRDDANQLAWLSKKQNGWDVHGKPFGGGFRLDHFTARTEGAVSLAAKLSSDAFQNDQPKPEKPENKLLHSVLFDGTLIVTDPVRFHESVESGIGPAKAFGFGLLSLARLES